MKHFVSVYERQKGARGGCARFYFEISVRFVKFRRVFQQFHLLDEARSAFVSQTLMHDAMNLHVPVFCELAAPVQVRWRGELRAIYGFRRRLPRER